MTTQDKPAVGPLSAGDVTLLEVGDLLRHEQGIFPFRRVRDCGDVVVDAPVLSPYDRPEAFAFIGRPGPDGWIKAPEGGWKENPVPGQRVEVCHKADGLRSYSGIIRSEQCRWEHLGSPCDIIAFRLAPTAPVEASGSEREKCKCRGTGVIGWGSLNARRCSCGAKISRPLNSDEWPAEPQVGRAVYERIEKLLTTDSQGWERDYLCHLVESVEELGGYGGPRLDRRDDRQAVADFLKLRDEKVGPGEADDAERLESADAILAALSTTPARAEAQDEGAAGDREYADGEILAFGLRMEGSSTLYPAIRNTKEGADKLAARLVDESPENPPYRSMPLYAHPSPTPAADADRVRIAVEALERDVRALCVGHPHSKIEWPHRELHDIADRLAALRPQPSGETRAVDLEGLKRLQAEAVKYLAGPNLKADEYGLQVWGDCPKDGVSHVFDVRGWGELTGRGAGAQGLSEKEGIAAQRARQAYLVAAWNSVPALISEIERLALITPADQAKGGEG